MNKDTKIIVVDGLIGAGKSTFVTVLHSFLQQKGYRVISCLEPVQKWIDSGILGLFYKDAVQYGYAFQTFTFVTRIQGILQQLEQYKGGPLDFLLLERSILTDRYVFMNLLEKAMDPLWGRMYAEWWDLHARLLPFDLKQCAHFIYLQTSPEEAMRRMNKRGRPEEVVEQKGETKYEQKERVVGGVSLNYQRQLHTAHVDFFKTHLSASQITILDEKLCQSDFTSASTPAFLSIVKALESILHTNNPKKEKETEECDKTYKTMWDRMC